MLLILQIAIGSGVLVACALIHVGIVVASIPALRRLGDRFDGRPIKQSAAVLSATVFTLLFAHTVQIWIWAALLMVMQQFEDLPTAIYFSIVTYTTTGYGDIVLDPYARIIATFASVTGLITFGISTAVVISVLTRLMPQFFKDSEPK